MDRTAISLVKTMVRSHWNGMQHRTFAITVILKLRGAGDYQALPFMLRLIRYRIVRERTRTAQASR